MSSASTNSDATLTGLPLMVSATLTLAERELRRFFRQRTRIIGALGQPVMFWLLFGTGLRGSFQPPAWGVGQSYAEYFFPGVAVMILLFTAIFSTISIIEDRREGFLQGVLVAPVPRAAIVLGKVLGGTALALLQVSVFWLLAPLAGVWTGPLEIAALVLFFALSGMALTALGFAIAWPMESTQGFHAIMSVVLMPMWLLSGAFFPAEGAGPLGWIMRLNPMTYMVAGSRRILYHAREIPATWDMPPLWVCVLVVTVFGGACLGVGLRMVERRVTRDER